MQLHRDREPRRARPGFLSFCLCAGFVLGGVAAQAQQASQKEEPPPSIPRARQLLAQQDWAGAAKVAEALLASDPKNGTAWGILGFARMSSDDFEGAVEALTKAAADPTAAPRASFNLARTYAKMGKTDEALTWLGKARDSRGMDMTQVLATAEFTPLLEDKRLQRLLPGKKEFADPFVEKTKILQEWVGEAANDQFGWIARNIGDVDKDGIADVTTSAPTHGENGSNHGAVYVYSSKTGKQLWRVVGEPGEQLGLGIEAAGDVNADGIPDVIAGAPGGDKAYVYHGRTGAVLLTLKAEQPGELFGRKVSDVGDWNHDGHDDVLVGAPQNNEKGNGAGRAGLYSGKDGSLLWNAYGEKAGDAYGSSGAGQVQGKHAFIVVGSPNAGPANGGRTYVYGKDGKQKFAIEADETGVQLGGMFVSVVGDVDADGVPDVYASDWPNAAKGRSTGRIYIHSGKTGERLMTLTGEALGDGFGIGPADAGDVDGDGHADLIIGAWQHAGGAPSGGKTYLYSGKTGEVIRTYTCKVDGETFGFDATGMGDVDGDGSIDFLLTSAWSAIKGYRSGRMFIVSGSL